MADPVLTEQDLATLLKVPGKTIEALLARTDIPRFTLDQKVRFLTSRVLAWLEERSVHHTELLPAEPPPPPKPPAAARPVRITHLPPARPPEHSWVSDEALGSLAEGASEPGRNLDRLKLRDALLELNDALLPTLNRRSGGRLHPHYEEKVRTSPWRLDLGTPGRINTISMAWGAGENAPPQFSDRPHVDVELAKRELRVSLDPHGHGFVPPLTEAELDELRDVGLAVEVDDAGHPRAFAKVYPLPQPAPSLHAIAQALESDIEHLVQLWARLA